MARTVARLCYPSRVAAAAVLTASSEATGSPRANLQDESRGVRWRSKTGWNVGAWNASIDFDRGGAKVATIASGNYATPALYGAAWVAALEAADATPVWAYSYDSGTGKFTFSTAAHAFTFLFGSGANVATSAALDAGFAEADQAAVAFAAVADTASYKSRETLTLDAGSAVAVEVGVVTDHNLGASGTLTLQGHTADAWTAPDVSEVLAGDATIRIAFFASVSKRYWRLLIDDVATNTNGYTEIGVWWVSPAPEPSVTYSTGWTLRREPMTTLSTSISGATRRDERPQRRVWTLAWSEVPAADQVILAAWADAVDLGEPFFLAFDSEVTPTRTVYGFFTQKPLETNTSGAYTDVGLEFAEALP